MPSPRQDLRRALHAVAFQQAGYFPAAQALEVGYSYQAQKYHADAGNWVRVGRALYAQRAQKEVSPDCVSDSQSPLTRWSG